MDAAIQALNRGLSPVFITGPAGSGKSTLLKKFKKQTRRNCAIVAPTGLAALNVGGVTAHSLFGLPLRLIQQSDIRANHRKAEVLKNLDVLIIDEISMMRADVLDGIDWSLRLNRGDGRPFGGVQLIMFGDPFQLPPVVAEQGLRDYFTRHYSSEFFFSAKALEGKELKRILLTKIYRQAADPGFRDTLNRIRVGTAGFDDWVLVNSRYKDSLQGSDLDGVLTLTTTNRAANAINLSRLERLSLPETTFEAKIEGDFSDDALPVDKVLRVRKGAQIMMLRNNGTSWVNGSIGTVRGWSDDGLSVRLDGQDHIVERETWRKVDYEYDREKRAIVEVERGSVTQFPVRLAWALTIHKSQGKTLDKVAIDMGSGAFAPGQLYVALSRCKTLDGIFLKSQIDHMSMLVDSRIMEFMGLSGGESGARGSVDQVAEDRSIQAGRKNQSRSMTANGTYGQIKAASVRRRIDGAMKAGSIITIKYRDYSGSETVRPVRPLEWSDEDKFSAYCHLRSDEREFRVSRIVEIESD